MKIEVRVWVRTKKYEYACSFMAPETDDDRRQEEYSIKRNKYAESMHSLLWSFLALRATLIMLYFPELWIYSQRLLCSRHSIGNSRGTRLSVESIIFFFKFVEGQWFEKNHSPSYLEKKIGCLGGRIEHLRVTNEVDYRFHLWLSKSLLPDGL